MRQRSLVHDRPRRRITTATGEAGRVAAIGLRRAALDLRDVAEALEQHSHPRVAPVLEELRRVQAQLDQVLDIAVTLTRPDLD